MKILKHESKIWSHTVQYGICYERIVEADWLNNEHISQYIYVTNCWNQIFSFVSCCHMNNTLFSYFLSVCKSQLKFRGLCKTYFGNPYAHIEISLNKPRNTPNYMCDLIHFLKSGHLIVTSQVKNSMNYKTCQEEHSNTSNLQIIE